MGRTCSRHWEKKNAYKILVGNPEGNKPLGRPRYRREDNIKMDLTEIEWGGMYWIYLAQDRDWWPAHVNMVMNLRVPQNSGNFFSGWATVDFTRRARLQEVRYLVSRSVSQLVHIIQHKGNYVLVITSSEISVHKLQHNLSKYIFISFPSTQQFYNH
jgi:hypothetical protein